MERVTYRDCMHSKQLIICFCFSGAAGAEGEPEQAGELQDQRLGNQQQQLR